MPHEKNTDDPRRTSFQRASVGKIPISNYSLQHKIMKATIFLMIYNMLENIIPLALKKVCDEINKKNVKY